MVVNLLLNLLEVLVFGAAGIIVYLAIGFWLSLKAAPLSWMQLQQQAEKLQRGEKLTQQIYDPAKPEEGFKVVDQNGIDWGNIPLFVFFWPWPAAAHGWFLLTGKYPRWTPAV